MLWTNQLEVATIERQQAFDVQAFRYCDDQSVYKVEVSIGVLPEDLCGAQVVFLGRGFPKLIRLLQGWQ
jgi:hypothetical protein